MLRLPKLIRGRPSRPSDYDPNSEPSPGWDPEIRAIEGIGEWLHHIRHPDGTPNREGQYRALSFWMWRLKSGDTPHITEWVEAVAEESAVKLATQHGFAGGVDK